MHHPALDLFRDDANATLGKARFPRWWKVTATGQASAAPVALLNTGDPWLVEGTYRRGKVLLAAVPPDRSWGSTLPGTWEFPVLAHELVYALADTRSAEFNLTPGQPLRYHPPGVPAPTTVVVHSPGGGRTELPVERWPLVYEEAWDTGVYRVEAPGARPAYYVVEPDPQESDLTPCGESDRKKVAALVPVQFTDDLETVAAAMAGEGEELDVWWVLMIGVIVLLCGEVWMTRRMVANR